jgi:hypothetical protein
MAGSCLPTTQIVVVERARTRLCGYIQNRDVNWQPLRSERVGGWFETGTRNELRQPTRRFAPTFALASGKRCDRRKVDVLSTEGNPRLTNVRESSALS